MGDVLAEIRLRSENMAMKDMETERLHLIPGDQVVFYTPTTRFQVEVSAAVTLTVTAHEFVQPKAKRRWWFRG